MSEGALFLKFWEKEGATAREVAWLIVREEIALGDGLRKGQLEWIDVPAPKTMKDVLDEYDRHHDKITAEFRAMGSTVPQIYGPSADEPM